MCVFPSHKAADPEDDSKRSSFRMQAYKKLSPTPVVTFLGGGQIEQKQVFAYAGIFLYDVLGETVRALLYPAPRFTETYPVPHEVRFLRSFWRSHPGGREGSFLRGPCAIQTRDEGEGPTGAVLVIFFAFAIAHSVCSTQRFIGGRGKEGRRMP